MLSSDDEDDVATLISSSDHSEIEEELTAAEPTRQNRSSQPEPNRSSLTESNRTQKTESKLNQNSNGPKLLPRRKPERPKTLPTLKENQRYSPRPSSKQSDYSFDFHSDEEDEEDQPDKTATTSATTKNRFSKSAPTSKNYQRRGVVQRRIVSPYGECLLTTPVRRPSSTTDTSTIIDTLFEDVPGSRPTKGHVRDRISSAKARWKKERMNDVATMHRKILELTDENRTLNRLVKRQSLALNRLAGSEGELPILLRAHNEETRVLRQKMKQAQELNRVYEKKLEEKSREANQVREANKKLEALSQNKQLRDRGTLEMELQEVKMHLQARDTEVRELYHRILILEKSSRQQLKLERNRVLGLKKKLDEAEQEIKRLKEIIKEKEKIIHRSNIYSRQFLTPSVSYGNIGNGNSGFGSISAGNSVVSLNVRTPSSSGDLNSKSKTRSKSFNINIDKMGKESSTKKKTTNSDDEADFGWGITESKKSVGDVVKKNDKRLTRKSDSIKRGLTSPTAQSIKNGLTGQSDSGSSSSSSSSDDDDDVTDDEKDRASTLYGVDDMPETHDQKDASENEQDELTADPVPSSALEEMEEKSEMPQAVGTVATATSVETNANPDEPEERAVVTNNPDEPVSTKLTDEITSDPTNGINPPLSDEEDEGIGNGETQSEKDGDTPAELKQDILQNEDDADADIEESDSPNDEKGNKDKENVEKLGLWLPKEMQTHSPRSQTEDSNHRTSSLVLSGDRKANLLAKLRDLDAEHGVQNSKQDSSYVPSFGYSTGKGGRSGSATRNFLLNGLYASDTPFSSATLRDAPSSASSSPTSSIRSVAVANGKAVDPQKKALLMNELFGAKIQTEVGSKQAI